MYPIEEPLRSGMLQVSALHQIYWEESGNPDGIPVIFLHGGPGAGRVAQVPGFFQPGKNTASSSSTSAAAAAPSPTPKPAKTPPGIWWPTSKKVREMLGIESLAG